MHSEHNSLSWSQKIFDPKRKLEMQIVESYQAVSSNHFLMDEIYAPNLNDSANAGNQARVAASKAQEHLKAINELHRFLESSCDCV